MNNVFGAWTRLNAIPNKDDMILLGLKYYTYVYGRHGEGGRGGEDVVQGARNCDKLRPFM